MTEETCPFGLVTVPRAAARPPPRVSAHLARATRPPPRVSAPPAGATRPALRVFAHLARAACPALRGFAHLAGATRPALRVFAHLARAARPALRGFAHLARAARPALRVFALVAWAALAGACSDRRDDPVRAAQAFVAAVQRGDMDALYPLIDRAAAARLAAAAARASDQVGGRRRIEPAEMLQIVDVDPNFELASAELESPLSGPPSDGTVVKVRLLGSQQETYTLTLVFEDGAWHVQIPQPPPLASP